MNCSNATTNSITTNNSKLMKSINCSTATATTVNNSVRLFTKLLLGVFVFLVMGSQQGWGQIYQENFGSSNTVALPYASGTNPLAGVIKHANISNPSWNQNYPSGNLAGNPSGCMSINPHPSDNGYSVYCTFIVAPGYTFTPTTIGFSNQGSSTGPSGLRIEIYGTGGSTARSLAVAHNGAFSTTAPVSFNSTTQQLSGTISLYFQFSGGSGGSTERLDNVILNGTICANNTASAPSPASSSLCVNSILNTITHTTTGATGIAQDNVQGANGLPPGVKANWASNTITITGTPTAAGTYDYSIPLTGGCGSINATGTITVTPSNTVGAASYPPTLCINTPLSPNVTHSITNASGIGGNNVPGANGLPAGVKAVFGGSNISISGTPTASGTFNYSIPVTVNAGFCNAGPATGTIIVNGPTCPADFTICANAIPYTLGGATPGGGTYSGPDISGGTLTSAAPGAHVVFYTESGCVCSFTITVVAGNNTWLGVNNSGWFNAANWSCGIPTATSDITIPSGTPNPCVIPSGTAGARNITIQSGASLTNNGTLTIASGGVVTQSGTFNNNGTFNQ